MNTRIAAWIAVAGLTFGAHTAVTAEPGAAPLTERDSGVGLLIAAQGDQALRAIRGELASALRESTTLPELEDRTLLGQVPLPGPLSLSPTAHATRGQ